MHTSKTLRERKSSARALNMLAAGGIITILIVAAAAISMVSGTSDQQTSSVSAEVTIPV